MPLFRNLNQIELIMIVIFLVILIVGGLFASKSLNLNIKDNLSVSLKPYRNKILINVILFVLLLFVRGIVHPMIESETTIRFLDKTLTILIFIMLYRFFSLFLEILDRLYSISRISLRRPLKPLFQALRILVFIVLLFGLVAIVLDRDPFVVMGSLSTILAFVSFIFKDILLGFFAGIQLTTSDTLQIGDYVSIPELNISGTVSAVGLSSVTLIQTNQTHITVGSYSLLQNPIINFRHLSSVDGRQYQRRFNFKPLNEMNFNNFINEVRNVLQQHAGVNPNKTISVQIEEGPTNNLVLVVSCFSMYSKFDDFDQFSSGLSAQILNVLASNQLFY